MDDTQGSLSLAHSVSCTFTNALNYKSSFNETRLLRTGYLRGSLGSLCTETGGVTNGTVYICFVSV